MYLFGSTAEAWHTGAAWTSDSRTLLFTSLRVEDAEYEWRETEIYAVDVAGGGIRQLTTRHGPDGSPIVSPDGRQVAYLGYDWVEDTYIDRKIYLMDIDGTNHRLDSGDWDRSPTCLLYTYPSPRD